MLIYAVCGAGIGSSVLLKSNADRVLANLGLDATVKAVSLDEALHPDSMAQVLLITPELEEKVGSIRSEVVVIGNIFDLAELTQKLTASLD